MEVQRNPKIARRRRSPADALEFKARLLSALQVRVDDLVSEGAPDLVGSPEEVADRMVAAVPRMHVYDELVGPFYSTDAVRTMLGGVSRQAVHERARPGRRTLLRLRTSDGVSLYPAFQFEGSEVPPRVREAIAAFRHAPVDGWTIASWFSVPAESLGGLSPRAWLGDACRDPRPVYELALRTAQRWSAP